MPAVMLAQVLAVPQVAAGLGQDVARCAWLAQIWPDVGRQMPDLPLDDAAALALDIAALWGKMDAGVLRARLGMMAVRASSRLRAQNEGASKPNGHGVKVQSLATPYAQFFAVEEYDLTHPLFDGGTSGLLRRAAFVSGDAVTVLPYDPARGRILLVEQFRTGPLARGAQMPWQMEPVAGRIDAGETPECAALREAREEAGLMLSDLHLVAAYYPSPGAMSEYLYSYVARCDLPDTAAGTFGLASEGEDIKARLFDLAEALALLGTGRLTNGPLILTLLWLAQNRDLIDRR